MQTKERKCFKGNKLSLPVISRCTGTCLHWLVFHINYLHKDTPLNSLLLCMSNLCCM